MLPELLRPEEVGEAMNVNPRTVTRWAADGIIPAIRTLGRHRRIPTETVLALLTANGGSRDTAEAVIARAVTAIANRRAA